MDDRSAKFLVFLLFGLGCFLGGVWLRGRREDAGRFAPPVHLYSVVLFWTPVALIGFWTLRIDAQLFYLLGLQPLLMIGMGVASYLATRGMTIERRSRGEVVLAGALSNIGFAMGAYLCYVLFADGEAAFGYGLTMLTVMQLCMILVFYPVADWFGPDAGRSPLHAIRASLINIRALPIHVVPLGLALNLGGVPFPRGILDSYLLDALFFAGAGGGYLGIGLNFRLRRPASSAFPLHALVFAAKFVFTPLLALGLLESLALLGFAPLVTVRNVLLLESAMPVAISASMISNLFGLDGELASELWFYNMVLFCLGPLWAVVWLFRGAL